MCGVRACEEFLEHCEQAVPMVWERIGLGDLREPRGFVLWDYIEQPGFSASMHLKASSMDWFVQIAMCHSAGAPVAKVRPSTGVNRGRQAWGVAGRPGT